MAQPPPQSSLGPAYAGLAPELASQGPGCWRAAHPAPQAQPGVTAALPQQEGCGQAQFHMAAESGARLTPGGQPAVQARQEHADQIPVQQPAAGRQPYRQPHRQPHGQPQTGSGQLPLQGQFPSQLQNCWAERQLPGRSGVLAADALSLDCHHSGASLAALLAGPEASVPLLPEHEATFLAPAADCIADFSVVHGNQSSGCSSCRQQAMQRQLSQADLLVAALLSASRCLQRACYTD